MRWNESNVKKLDGKKDEEEVEFIDEAKITRNNKTRISEYDKR